MLLREKLRIQRNFARDSMDFASSGEMFHAKCWLPKYLVCGYSLAVIVGILLFSRNLVVKGERIVQSAQSWCMTDFRLVALLTPIWMLQLILVTSTTTLFFFSFTLSVLFCSALFCTTYVFSGFWAHLLYLEMYCPWIHSKKEKIILNQKS